MYRSIIDASQPGEEETAPHAVAAAAADLAAVIHASAIVAFTSSGTTAARIARKRPKVSILAVTPDQRVSRQLCLLWGAHSVLAKDVSSYEEMVDRATQTALSEEFAKPDGVHRGGGRYPVRRGRHDEQPARGADPMNGRSCKLIGWEKAKPISA